VAKSERGSLSLEGWVANSESDNGQVREGWVANRSGLMAKSERDKWLS
jgi:hypothetical protein